MTKKNASVSLDTPEDWQVESDLRTLLDAEKIEKDPKRMAKVRKLAQSKMLAVAAIASEDGKDGS